MWVRTAFYAVFLGHVLAPAFGTTLDSAALIDLFASLPGWFATSLKGAVAAAGSYHTLNGLRHLGWDMGYCESSCAPVPEPSFGARDGAREGVETRLGESVFRPTITSADPLGPARPAVLDLKASYMAGYVVLGATALSTAAILAL